MVSKRCDQKKGAKAHTTPEYSSTHIHTYTHSMNDKMIVMKGPYGLVGTGFMWRKKIGNMNDFEFPLFLSWPSSFPNPC